MRILGAAAVTMVLVGLTANCGSDQNTTSGPRTGGDSGTDRAGSSGASSSGQAGSGGKAGSSGASTSGPAGSGGKGGTSGQSSSSAGCTQIVYVDAPCSSYGSLREPKCSQDSPGIRVVGEDVSCREATGTSCCGGAACRATDERCEADEACAYPNATPPYSLEYEEAKCLPTSQLCGGAENQACPEGQYCERYGVFYAMTLSTSTPCEYAAGGGMGVCHPLPSESECASDSQPVCGCDGVTYANECARKKASAAYYGRGECPGGLVESSRDGGND